MSREREKWHLFVVSAPACDGSPGGGVSLTRTSSHPPTPFPKIFPTGRSRVKRRLYDQPRNAASVTDEAGVDGFRRLMEDSFKFRWSSERERDQRPISAYAKETFNPPSGLQ